MFRVNLLLDNNKIYSFELKPSNMIATARRSFDERKKQKENDKNGKWKRKRGEKQKSWK